MAGLKIRDTEKWKQENSSPVLKLNSHVENYIKQTREARAFGKSLFKDISDDIKSIESVLPEGVELLGWQIDGEEEVTEEMIKRAKEGLGMSKSPKREFKKMYRFRDVEIAIASDDTVWFLEGSDSNFPRWSKMNEAGYPELPQD